MKYINGSLRSCIIIIVINCFLYKVGQKVLFFNETWKYKEKLILLILN